MPTDNDSVVGAPRSGIAGGLLAGLIATGC